MLQRPFVHIEAHIPINVNKWFINERTWLLNIQDHVVAGMIICCPLRMGNTIVVSC